MPLTPADKDIKDINIKTKDQDRYTPSEKKELNRKIARIALPIALQGVISATLSMIDTLMVGMLGEKELAAVGVGQQLTFIHYMLLFGFTSGCATFMAQFNGTKDYANIRKVVGFAWTVLLCVGAIFFTVSNAFTDKILSFYTTDSEVLPQACVYLRTISIQYLTLAVSAPAEMAFKATQKTKLPMISNVAVFSTNTFFNYVLIFGKFGAPALGVHGAALATALSRIVQISIDGFFLFSKHNTFRGTLASFFGWKRELCARVVKNSIPTTANELLWAAGQSMYAAAFNRIGTTDYAAYQAANAIANILWFGAFSVGDATLILIGEKLGQGEKDGAWKLSRHMLKIGWIVGFIAAGGLIAMAYPLAGVFNLTELGTHYTFQLLIFLALTQPLGLYNGIIITGILRGGGDTRFAAISETCCVWLIGVPMAFIAATVWHLPIPFTFLLTKLEELVKSFIMTWRWRSKKWINVVIHDL
ncbi:MAG: MATE family efflux transporter [Eubacterium sp.]|jgi:putative MATE family efflux protein